MGSSEHHANLHRLNLLESLAFEQMHQGDLLSADNSFRTILKVREMEHGGKAHPSISVAINNLAVNCMKQGNLTEAQALLDQASILNEQLSLKGDCLEQVTTRKNVDALMSLQPSMQEEHDVMLRRPYPTVVEDVAFSTGGGKVFFVLASPPLEALPS